MELKWTKHAIKRGYTRLGRYGMDIIEENYIPADNYVLGECLSNIHMKLDNRTKDCSGTWKFSLTPNVVKKKKKVVKKPITKKNSRKK